MEILKKGYNRAEFKKLIMNVFKKGNIFLEIPDMQENSDDKIEKGYLLGEFEFDNSEFAVFEYKVADSLDLERNKVGLNRRMLKEGKEYLYDFLIGVYYNEKTKVWRLSLINIEYNENKDKTTSLKRYTYLLGENIPVNTATKQINDLINKKELKTIDELLKAFSVEPVTKEFFNEIGRFFTKLVSGERKIGSKKFKVEESSRSLISYPSVEKEMEKKFAVRLIGRIVFVWFLKKKELIPEEILSSKAVESSKNYYHDILEKLFFEVLNKKHKFRLKNIQANDLFNKIPFLNGGLFDAQGDDFYKLNESTQLTEYINLLKIKNEWFKELFEVFERYNFTIEESSIYDVEISIDPEMLGRIFENLLAEINPETGKTARKASGSYYTPREIVDYMVTESLKEYFYNNTDIDKEKIDNLFLSESSDLDSSESKIIVEVLDKIKILDPAVGSGAFPMGILQKILFILKKVDADNKIWKEKKLKNVDSMLRKKLEKENWNYLRKLGIIRDAIYGVDIQPVAIDISRLRFFLSLIVEQKTDDEQENRGVLALPNLDFKFVAANSLIGLEKSKKGAKKSLFGEPEEVGILKGIRNEFFTVSGEEKYALEVKYQKVRDRLLEKYLTDSDNTFSENSKKIAKWNPFSDESSEFFDMDWMFGIKDGFDIVIGNPPYIQLQKALPESSLKYADLYKNENFKTFERTGDIYALFYEKGVNSLKKCGNLCFITSNKWMRAKYGKSLRKFFSNYKPKLLIDLGSGVFESATVDTNILLILKNSPLSEGCQPKADGVFRDTTRNAEGNVVFKDTGSNTKEKHIFLKYKSLPYNPNLKEKAKFLRKQGILTEVLFWNAVKNKQFLGADFHRQKIIGNYIVDFYCPEFNLVVEIDGSSHDFKAEYDAKRDEYLKSLNLNIVHFEAKRVEQELDIVLDELEGFCKELMKGFKHPALSGHPSNRGEFKGEFKGEYLRAITLRKNRDLSSLKENDFNIMKNLSEESWIILSREEQGIKEKIEKIGTPLKEWDINIYRGLLTGYNNAFIINTEKRNEILADCKTETEKERTKELIKPILRGKDIRRYKAEWADLWLINTHNGYKNIKAIDINNYPSVKKHLNHYYEKLVKRYDKGITPYNLRNCAYLDEFEKEKIIFQEMVQESSFLYDNNNNYYCLDTGRIVTGENIKILVAIMNSKLFFFSVKSFYGGGELGATGIRMKHTFFEKFPIPKIPKKQQTPFETLVERIIAIKKEENNVLKRLKPTVHSDEPTALAVGENSKLLEDKIDIMVYKLYKLTYDEIKIIDPDFDSVLNEFNIDRVKYENMSIEEIGEM